MPPKPKKPVAPERDAPIEAHRKHAAEVLEYEPFKRKPPKFRDLNDEANP